MLDALGMAEVELPENGSANLPEGEISAMMNQICRSGENYSVAMAAPRLRSPSVRTGRMQQRPGRRDQAIGIGKSFGSFRARRSVARYRAASS